MAEDTDNGRLRTFALLISQLSEGKLHDKLTRGMIDLIGDIQNAETEGAKPVGALTLKLKFVKDGRMMKIVPDVKIERPKEPALEADQLYVTPGNELTLNDQRQPALPLRDANGGNVSSVRAV